MNTKCNIYIHTLEHDTLQNETDIIRDLYVTNGPPSLETSLHPWSLTCVETWRHCCSEMETWQTENAGSRLLHIDKHTHTHTRKSTASSYEHVPRIINWNWERPLCMLNTKNQPTLYKIALLVSKCECKVFLSIKHYGMDNSVYNYHNSIFRVKWPKFHDWRCNFARTDPHEGARAHYESGIIIYKLSGTNWGGFSSIPTNGHRQCKQIGSPSKKTQCFWPRFS